MSIELNSDLLVELGYGSLTATQGNQLLKEFYETLEAVVGIHLTEEMTESQYEAFSKFFEAKDDAGAAAWLDRNFPDHKEVVQKTFDQLAYELRKLAQSIDEPPLPRDELETDS